MTLLVDRSGHVHIHEGERHVGDVCTGTGTYYLVRTRFTGYQKYDLKTRHRSKRAALIAMAKLFSGGLYKRVDVLLCADYYDPVQIAELVKR